MIYLVDYENVSLSGLAGIEKLGEEDKVVVFVGNNLGSIPFEWHIRIADSRPEVKYIRCGKVSKNYLDFQLATFCGYLMAGLENDKVYVVSKDKGYDSVVDFWTENKPDVGVKRVESIDESLGILLNKEKNQSQRQRRSGTRTRGRRNNNNRQSYSAEVPAEIPAEENKAVAVEAVETPVEETKIEAVEAVETPVEETKIEAVEAVETPVEEIKVVAAETVESPMETPTEETKNVSEEVIKDLVAAGKEPEAEEVKTVPIEAIGQAKSDGPEEALEQAEEAKAAEPEPVEEVIEEAKAAEAELVEEVIEEVKAAEAGQAAEALDESKQAEKGKEQKEKKKQKKQKEQKEQKEKKAAEPVMNKLSESTKKHIRQKIKDEQLKGGSYKTIYNIFMTEKAKNRFNTALVKAFQQERGNRIYKKLVSEFEEHLKSQKEE